MFKVIFPKVGMDLNEISTTLLKGSYQCTKALSTMDYIVFDSIKSSVLDKKILARSISYYVQILLIFLAVINNFV